MYFWADARYSLGMVRLRAKHAQLTFEQVAEISKGTDPDLTIQVSFYIAAMSLHGRWFEFTRQYLTRTRIALNAASLRFAPVTGRPPILTNDIRERVVMLSKVIYLETYLLLVVDETEPNMTVRIEKEFRQELQVRPRFLIPYNVD